MKVLLLYSDKYYLIKQVYPFGLDLIARCLRRSGHTVSIEYPFLPRGDVETNLNESVQRFDPDVIGLGIRNLDTCMSWETYGDFQGQGYRTFFFLPHIKEMVEAIKRARPEVPIIAGGGGFTISPAAVLDYLGLEYGIAGQGEEPLRRFLEAYPYKGAVSRIPGLVYREGNRFQVNQRGAYAFDSEPGHAGREPKFRHAYESAGLPVQVKRGCNQRCSYCVEPQIEGRGIVFRDMERVIEELRQLGDQNDHIRDIFFVDTEFNLPDLSYAGALVRKIIEQGLQERFRFTSQFLPRPFDSALASLLAEAGFSVILTCDSLSDEVLEKNGVSYRRQDILRTMHLCEDHHIGCTLAMIFGLPGETYETMDHTIGQMNRHPPHVLRRYEYTIGGRIYNGTPLCRFIETGAAERHLYGDKTDGCLEPFFFCAPDSPEKLKAYIQASFPYPTAYENRYTDDRTRELGVRYLVDQGNWHEAKKLFLRSPLMVQADSYEYLFRRLTEAGRVEEARGVSLALLEGIRMSDDRDCYGEQARLVHFYLGLLG